MNVQLRPHVTRAAEGLSRRRFSVAEVETMVTAGLLADERNELIGGELVPMSPKGNRHEVLKVALLRRWYKLAPDDVEIAPETTFRLSEDTFLEPDIVVFDRAAGIGGLTGDGVFLVVEISDSSLGYDMGRKAALYASFGVRELWVIDAVRLVTHVFRAPAPEGYGVTKKVTAGRRLVPLIAPDLFALRLADLAAGDSP